MPSWANASIVKPVARAPRTEKAAAKRNPHPISLSRAGRSTDHVISGDTSAPAARLIETSPPACAAVNLNEDWKMVSMAATMPSGDASGSGRSERGRTYGEVRYHDADAEESEDAVVGSFPQAPAFDSSDALCEPHVRGEGTRAE